MTTLFKSSPKRSAISAVMMVLAVLVVGGTAKSRGASCLAQMVHIADTGGEVPLARHERRFASSRMVAQAPTFCQFVNQFPKSMGKCILLVHFFKTPPEAQEATQLRSSGDYMRAKLLRSRPHLFCASISSWASGALADQSAVNDKPVIKKARTASTSKAKPDKNQYWLLNFRLVASPALRCAVMLKHRPADEIECAVHGGCRPNFQYETDLVNFTHQVSGTTTAPTLCLCRTRRSKLASTNNADLEVNVPFAGVHTYSTVGGPSATLRGIRRYLSAFENQPLGEDGGDTAAAIIPYVKAPSAPIGIGNGAVEGGLIGPVDSACRTALPFCWYRRSMSSRTASPTTITATTSLT